MIEAIVGFDQVYHVDLGQLPMMGRNDVGGTSTKNILHWIQLIRSNYFRQFDYGSTQNKKVYGTSSPPIYDISNFKSQLGGVRIFLINGKNDVLVAPDDYKRLVSVMPQNAKFKTLEDYNHLDYMWASDVNEFINADVKDFLLSL